MLESEFDRNRAAPPAFDVVAIAASLGGLGALRVLLSQLPVDFPAPIVVAQHRIANAGYMLSEVLRWRTSLHVKEATDGEPLRPGVVLLGPPDRHLVVAPGRTAGLSAAPKVNFARPSADVLFASAAAAFGPRALGVVLTGKLRDGARGACAIKRQGGRVIAQDEATSVAFSMPQAAIATGCVDFVLPLESIASALVTLVMVRGAAELFKVPIAPWARLTG